MATDRSPSSRNAVLVAAAACGIAVLLGLWWGLAAEPPANDAPAALVPAAEGVSETTAEANAAAPPEPGPPVPAGPPLPRIDPSGRLTVAAGDLPDETFALALGMSPEARGGDPRPARIAAEDGRSIETTAIPVAGPDGGVRLEIDPEWLVPGLYLIEIQNAEKKAHFPLRRYVLEIR